MRLPHLSHSPPHIPPCCTLFDHPTTTASYRLLAIIHWSRLLSQRRTRHSQIVPYDTWTIIHYSLSLSALTLHRSPPKKTGEDGLVFEPARLLRAAIIVEYAVALNDEQSMEASKQASKKVCSISLLASPTNLLLLLLLKLKRGQEGSG